MWISIALVTVAGLVLAPAAMGDTASSSNWAGYAVHRSGLSFQKVSASWRQPTVSCTDGESTYSAFWVGIGGFSADSPALEQIGTEADCNRYGRPVLSTWYELVPAPSTAVSFPLSAGDLIDATVSVKGHRVTLSLYDTTRRRGFTKTLSAQALDTSSAEWIVEAPSDCNGIDACQTLPLANFGTSTFTGAKAQSSTGRLGSISNSGWSATKIDLLPGGRRFTAYQDSGPAAAQATPSVLLDGGSEFKVAYSLLAGSNPFMSVRSAGPVAVGLLVHPVALAR